jgi:hypothetical protein
MSLGEVLVPLDKVILSIIGVNGSILFFHEIFVHLGSSLSSF